MTREEFDKGIEEGLPVAYICSKYITSLEQRNAELEQRVKELEEPKTCEGCKYVVNCFIIDSLNARMATDGFSCNRYEPM